jgi:hypothetical protein
MAKSKHFLGTGDCKFHTARPNSCFRSCNYRTAKEGTYGFTPAQAHHVVPCAAIVAYKEQPAYSAVVTKMDAVFYATDYCVSQPHNVMLLPLKDTYTTKRNNIGGSGGQRQPAGTTAVWDSNLPCHNWGHPAYMKEVIDSLNAKVWRPLANAVSKNSCPDPETIPNQLKSVETLFANRLKQRGKRAGATKAAIKNAGAKPRWWFAFSMAKAAQAAAEPAVSFGQSAGIPKNLVRTK